MSCRNSNFPRTIMAKIRTASFECKLSSLRGRRLHPTATPTYADCWNMVCLRVRSLVCLCVCARACGSARERGSIGAWFVYITLCQPRSYSHPRLAPTFFLPSSSTCKCRARLHMAVRGHGVPFGSNPGSLCHAPGRCSKGLMRWLHALVY